MLNISEVRLTSLKNSQYVIPFRMQYKQNNVSKTWDLVQSHSSVGIIIYNVTRKVLVCVKQFRPGVYLNSIPDENKFDEINTKKYPPSLGVTLEFCAGIIDKNKSIEEIAAEEVIEECGYKVEVSNLEKIQTFRCSVGISGDFQTLFYTEVQDSMRVSAGGGVESELIEVTEISLEEGRALLKAVSPTVPGEFLYGLLWFFSNKVKS